VNISSVNVVDAGLLSRLLGATATWRL